jgi:hypothetical protein
MCIITLFMRIAFGILFNCQWSPIILLAQSILYDHIFCLVFCRENYKFCKQLTVTKVRSLVIASDLISRIWLSKTLEQEVSVWPNFLLPTEYPIPSQAIACGVYAGQSSTGSGFLRLYQFSLVSIIPLTFLTHISFTYHRRHKIIAIGSSVKKKTPLCFQIHISTTPRVSQDIRVLSREALLIKLKL